MLRGVDGILVPGGFGDRGFEGKVLTAEYARKHGVPYFGICYGMQAAVVDYARHVAGLEGANSTENDKQSPHPVIGLITEWRTASGDVEKRDEKSDLGGSMRLGLQEQRLKPGTLARELYGKDILAERHRHRYEFNNRYRTQLEDAGLVISAKSMDDLLVEMVELPRTPDSISEVRISMGWVKLRFTPGIASPACRMASMSSSLVLSAIARGAATPESCRSH